ncbi:cation/H(+) antiporter 15 [Cajanus cajan]|uniref:K(+)/H(+) antiporter 13 n=1 Tax=Cajanus cajan TaxID=3821 RepID=A0A151TQX0_CAJCA|nr:cation/H(+) antiporter 15 [Cajanus cajan]KYP69448.1 K(+)/H(+) antiporter 13 [Cajanus cajan]
MNSSDVETFDPIFTITNRSLHICFKRPASHGSDSALWRENSIEATLPSFALQFAIILSLNRILLLLSSFCHVPRIVANIFTGFLLGPSALGHWTAFIKHTSPLNNMVPLETVGGLILIYYVFLVGLEIDLKPIAELHNKKATFVAIAGTIFTLPIGFGLYYMLITDMWRKTLSHKHFRPNGAILWGITLSSSSEFPEIAKILSDLKFLLTENGQLALSASLINDLFSWTLLVLALTHFYYGSVRFFVITVVLVLVCLFVLHRFFKWLFDNEGMRDREFFETQVIFVLHLVLVFGFLTDGLGVLSVTGAFFLGVVIPQGVLNNAMQDRVQDFVGVFMMPLFFVAVGERINVKDLALDTHVSTLVVVVVLAFVAKIASTLVVTCFYQMPRMEGLSLALLMNTKGTMPLIILCTGRDRLELDNQTFGVMVLACWLMTLPVGPVSVALTKALKNKTFAGIQRKGTQPDSPLRVLACIHTKSDANVIINLLKASSPSVRTPIQVLAVELSKMTNRPTSSLIIRGAKKSSFASKSLKLDETEDTLSIFDNLSQAIFAEKMRIISDYGTMHKDILNLARRRGVTLILTTLYKQPTYDGLGAGAATARAVNIINRDHASKDEKKVVLESLVRDAPCSVAIFVDRGFSRKRSKEQRVAMFYIAGADDREALCYAWRMCKSPEVKLTVVRLVWDNPNDEFDEKDKEFIKGFVQQTGDMVRVRYLEKVVRDEKETVRLLNKIGNKGFDLYVVGRGHGRKMSLAQTVDPVLEEPALGPLGDALTDLNSAAETSILIFQRRAQHVEGKYARTASGFERVFDSIVEKQLMCPSMRSPPMIISQYD